VLTLSKLSLVVWLEAFLQPLYDFLSHSLKQLFLEFQRMCYVLTWKGNKIPKKCENKMDRHIVSYEMCDGMISTYDCKDAWWCFKNNIANEKLNLLLELELILGLHAILPLLDYVRTLIKFAQSHNMFICDVIDVVKNLPTKVLQWSLQQIWWPHIWWVECFWNIHQQESIYELVCRPKWWRSQLPCYWIIFLVLNNLWTNIVF
jgi:hypothetical protein